MPRAASHIFSGINADPSHIYNVVMSYAQIYREQILVTFSYSLHVQGLMIEGKAFIKLCNFCTKLAMLPPRDTHLSAKYVGQAISKPSAWSTQGLRRPSHNNILFDVQLWKSDLKTAVAQPEVTNFEPGLAIICSKYMLERICPQWLPHIDTWQPSHVRCCPLHTGQFGPKNVLSFGNKKRAQICGVGFTKAWEWKSDYPWGSKWGVHCWHRGTACQVCEGLPCTHATWRPEQVREIFKFSRRLIFENTDLNFLILLDSEWSLWQSRLLCLHQLVLT